jgi:hypothetical protein
VLYAALYGAADAFRVFLEHPNQAIVETIAVPSEFTGWTVLPFLGNEGHSELLQTLLEANLGMDTDQSNRPLRRLM